MVEEDWNKLEMGLPNSTYDVGKQISEPWNMHKPKDCNEIGIKEQGNIQEQIW